MENNSVNPLSTSNSFRTKSQRTQPSIQMVFLIKSLIVNLLRFNTLTARQEKKGYFLRLRN